ncbi:MAG: hypothetical protein Q3979_09980 [Actinomycetaceae bacterium]|nr:hypothetical protein [Actinomycetaceae bacterium]
MSLNRLGSLTIAASIALGGIVGLPAASYASTPSTSLSQQVATVEENDGEVIKDLFSMVYAASTCEVVRGFKVIGKVTKKGKGATYTRAVLNAEKAVSVSIPKGTYKRNCKHRRIAYL